MTRPAEFLDGQVQVRQAQGYRAGLDAVLLAAAVRLDAGQRALELGCGAGTALLCAARLNPDAAFTGLEKQEGVARLAQDNAVRNAMQGRVQVLQGDILALPEALRPDSFDAVFLNPPYFDDPAAIRRPKAGKDAAFVNSGARLADWIGAALKLTRGRGHVTLIQRAERLDACLAAFAGRAGDVRILQVLPREGAAAHRIIVRARKNVKTPLTLLPPLVLHGPGGRWTPAAEAILNGRAPVPLDA